MKAVRPPHPNCSGFTLIELLVVVAIISLLMSILVPSLSRARDLAKGAVCASNLRRLGVILVTYASENQGGLPRHQYEGADGRIVFNGFEWHRIYFPYISSQWVGRFQNDIAKITSLFDCPLVNDSVWQCGYVEPGSLDAYETAGTMPKFFDYGIWTDIAGWGEGSRKMVLLPAGQEIIAEAYRGNPWYSWGGPGAKGYNQCRVRPPAILTPSYNVGAHHDGSVNVLYIDGSVSLVDFR